MPASILYRLPPGVDFVAAQAMVTIATANHAFARLGEVRGRDIALVGPGHAGLILLQVLRGAGAARVTPLVTHQLPPAEAPAAMELAARRKEGVLRIVLKP